MNTSVALECKVEAGTAILHLCGAWRLRSLSDVVAALRGFILPRTESVVLDGSRLDSIDTAGGFLLFNPADNDATAYTNFYILQQHVKQAPQQAGPFGRGELRMLDRARPEQSLLVQYLLPPTIAEHDHPHVAGYRAFFPNREDARYRRMIDWIGETLEWRRAFHRRRSRRPDRLRPVVRGNPETSPCPARSRVPAPW